MGGCWQRGATSTAACLSTPVKNGRRRSRRLGRSAPGRARRLLRSEVSPLGMVAECVHTGSAAVLARCVGVCVLVNDSRWQVQHAYFISNFECCFKLKKHVYHQQRHGGVLPGSPTAGVFRVKQLVAGGKTLMRPTPRHVPAAVPALALKHGVTLRGSDPSHQPACASHIDALCSSLHSHCRLYMPQPRTHSPLAHFPSPTA